MARLRFNRLLSQFLEGIISLFVARASARATFGQFCRRRRGPLIYIYPDAPICRGAVARSRESYVARTLRSRLLFAGCRLRLGLLRPRTDRRLGVVGEDLGDA